MVRDLDLLEQLAAYNAVRVSLSITTLDAQLARTMEPRTSSPAARLRAIQRFERRPAFRPTSCSAPVIPGLNDSEIPAILTAAREAGAHRRRLRAVETADHRREPVFFDWLQRSYPNRIVPRSKH